jgi:hypothetical protein
MAAALTVVYFLFPGKSSANPVMKANIHFTFIKHGKSRKKFGLW